MPAGLAIVAVVAHAGLPVTPDVARVWPFTKPEIVAVSGGFAWPNGRLFASAVTVRVGSPTGGGTVTAPTAKLCVHLRGGGPGGVAGLVGGDRAGAGGENERAPLIEQTALAAGSMVKVTGRPEDGRWR